MDRGSFDALTRRASILTLGGAGLAALVTPIAADAKKKRSKTGDINVRCKQQVAAWTAFVPALCGDGPNCAELIACGSRLAVCDFTGFLVCINTGQAEMLVPESSKRDRD